MGNAPPEPQPITMPDPTRLIGKSHALLRHLGLDDTASVETLIAVVTTVDNSICRYAATDSQWVKDLVKAAWDRAALFLPSHTDHLESEHADGTSGRTGSTETNEGR